MTTDFPWLSVIGSVAAIAQAWWMLSLVKRVDALESARDTHVGLLRRLAEENAERIKETTAVAGVLRRLFGKRASAEPS